MLLKLSTVREALMGFIDANGLPPQFEGASGRLKRSIEWFHASLKDDFTEETFGSGLAIAKRTTRGKFPLLSSFYGWGDHPVREGMSKQEEDKLRKAYDG